MTDTPSNIHATAIVVGSTGLLFMGPSGWGKSMLAFACINEAQRMGMSAILVADDQVLISKQDGTVIATCPATIAGLIELRGTGIVRLPHTESAVMHYAVLPGSVSGERRLPPVGERTTIADGIDLPVIRLLANTPLPLAVLMAKAPDIGE
ncbi:serine kinase of the HPr protein, regulates carbohydrate metabolism [Rhizobium sp. CF122]|uniref:HPr kinase/phosphorylase n=1 Tax=Rhizobium sp. CF122 TaxID=1144312 RepID=UPI000271C30B|nr:serine kinase of the HPr protein, regulates carbohydrate metabolism [Rhizobium sp. CF122]EJL52215.1 serine kinase of the HPr protein, regulates carbohydrate metabolism [Rhizobium sp. CF122]